MLIIALTPLSATNPEKTLLCWQVTSVAQEKRFQTHYLDFYIVPVGFPRVCVLKVSPPCPR